MSLKRNSFVLKNILIILAVSNIAAATGIFNGHENTYTDEIIRFPESALSSVFGNQVKITRFRTSPFTKTGENYDNVILRVNFTLKRTPDSPEESLQAIAKLPPPVGSLFPASKYKFQKETFFYEEIIPEYRKLLNAVSIKNDYWAKFYGSRLSLNQNKTEFDDDAVIFIENLNVCGYFTINRLKGLDQAHVESVLRILANFHGSGLAIREKNPMFFERMKEYSEPISYAELADLGEMLQRALFVKIDDSGDSVLGNRTLKLRRLFQSATRENNFLQNYLPDSPLSCCTHGDMWMGNLLFKDNDVKIIDFQTYFINTPFKDLLMFLLTSVNLETLRNGFEEFVEFYRIRLEDSLEKLGCPEIRNLVAKEPFWQQLKVEITQGFTWIFFMLKITTLSEDEHIYDPRMNDRYYERIKNIIFLMEKYGLM